MTDVLCGGQGGVGGVFLECERVLICFARVLSYVTRGKFKEACLVLELKMVTFVLVLSFRRKCPRKFCHFFFLV